VALEPRTEPWVAARPFRGSAAELEHEQDLRATVEALRGHLAGVLEVQSLIASGAGPGEVLGRAARTAGSVLEASGVVIRLAGRADPVTVWGVEPPDARALEPAAAEGTIMTSAGDLASVPEDAPIAWAMAPVDVDGLVQASVGVAWDPPEVLDGAGRTFLACLADLIRIALRSAELSDRLQQKEQALQGLLHKTLTAQEEERRRLSRELHDETSQVLSALIMNLDLLGPHAPMDEAGRSRIEAAKALAVEAARNLDRMLLELRPALLEELGLMPALRWYVVQMADLWDLAIELEGASIGRLPGHIELAAFRIVQEAVCNCARHARPSRVAVRVEATGGMLRLEIEDDGVGFDVREISARARAGEALGLAGMRERAEIVGGSFHLDSEPGRGARVVAEIPLPEDAGPAVADDMRVARRAPQGSEAT
jgi:signal transduction histidine kinase